MRDIPVIVISALDEIDSAVRCIEMGAEDYLPKPFNQVLLKARLSASLQKKKLRDLEKAYLQQEFMLRQSEKLATLGKLSAGMAHESEQPGSRRSKWSVAVTGNVHPPSRDLPETGKPGPHRSAVGGAVGTRQIGAGESRATCRHRCAHT